MKKFSWFIIGFLTAVNVTAYAVTSFQDETEFAEWNREAINKMQNNEIITGYNDGRYGPNDYVTRAQLAVILDRFAEKIVGKKLEGAGVGDSPTVQVSPDDDAIKGSSDAPVTIVEFSDYQCPFCSRYVNETLPQIKTNYIDTGKVKYVFRDFPLNFHANAKNAAIAAECAGEEGDAKYWEYHDKLFANQAAFDLDSLKQYAVDLELNADTFNSCLDSQKYKTEVEKDLADGQSAGVHGTPAFFINGHLVSGAQPYSVFEAAIEAELN